MGYDGMGWDGVGQDGIERDGTRWDVMRLELQSGEGTGGNTSTYYGRTASVTLGKHDGCAYPRYY